MAVKIWSGGAPTTAQVNTETPANANTGDIYYLQLADYQGLTHKISFTVAGTETVAAACDGLVAAAAAAKANSAGEWANVSVTDGTTLITITADTAGRPFYVTTSIYDGAGGSAPTLTDANTTACVGPNIFSIAENWVGDALPTTATDSVLIPAWATDDIYGENFIATVAELLGFTIEDGCDIDIGHVNKPLQIDLEKTAATTTSYPLVSYGIGDIFLDVDNFSLADIRNAGTGSPKDGEYAFNLSGTLTATSGGAVYVRCGNGKSVSLGFNPNEVLEAQSVEIWSGTVGLGSGILDKAAAAFPALTVEGGNALLKSPCKAIIVKAGTVTLEGAVAVATSLSIEGGTVYRNNSGTILAVYVYGGGTYDATNNAVTATDTAVNTWADSTYLDPHEQITRTANVVLNKCGLPGGSGATMARLDLGTDITIAKS